MLTYACLGACAILVGAEYVQHARLRIVAKLAASAAFVAIAREAAHGSAFQQWLFVGLVLGALGDAALLGRGTRAFVAGLAAFLAGHVAYIIACAQLVPLRDWLATSGWPAAAVVLAGLVVLRLLWPRLGKLRGAVIAYVAAIAAMVIGALAVYRAAALPEPAASYLAGGAALFFVSDLAVARDRFVARTFANKLWGLPAYYVAQLLIAHAAQQ